MSSQYLFAVYTDYQSTTVIVSMDGQYAQMSRASGGDRFDLAMGIKLCVAKFLKEGSAQSVPWMGNDPHFVGKVMVTDYTACYHMLQAGADPMQAAKTVAIQPMGEFKQPEQRKAGSLPFGIGKSHAPGQGGPSVLGPARNPNGAFARPGQDGGPGKWQGPIRAVGRPVGQQPPAEDAGRQPLVPQVMGRAPLVDVEHGSQDGWGYVVVYRHGANRGQEEPIAIWEEHEWTDNPKLVFEMIDTIIAGLTKGPEAAQRAVIRQVIDMEGADVPVPEGDAQDA